MNDEVLVIPDSVEENDIRSYVQENHPGAVKRVRFDDFVYSSLKEFADQKLGAFLDKGYIILVANDPRRRRYGYVAYKDLKWRYKSQSPKECQTIELAHHPVWPASQGSLPSVKEAIFGKKDVFES